MEEGERVRVEEVFLIFFFLFLEFQRTSRVIYKNQIEFLNRFG